MPAWPVRRGRSLAIRALPSRARATAGAEALERPGSSDGPWPGYPEVMYGLGKLDPAEREAFEERAAIAEFDGGMSRPVAECEATRMIGEMRWWRCHGADDPMRRVATPGPRSMP